MQKHRAPFSKTADTKAMTRSRTYPSVSARTRLYMPSPRRGLHHVTERRDDRDKESEGLSAASICTQVGLEGRSVVLKKAGPSLSVGLGRRKLGNLGRNQDLIKSGRVILSLR